jgi:hypothetical protein
MAYYNNNNNLYIFDAQAQQIYRHNKLNNNFISSYAWFKNPESLSNIKSIDINGDIYILNNNEILKYASGIKQDFSLKEIEPKLKNPDKIVVSKETKKYIYILEKKNKRILVYNTESGSLISQFTSPLFTNLTDFTINEKDKKAYLLNDGIIYEISI